MKHIRISGEDGGGNPIPPKTISEGEGMEEFKQNAFSYNTDNKSRIARPERRMAIAKDLKIKLIRRD